MVSGFNELEAFAREVSPAVARGNNLVAVMPPSPAYAKPVLAALLERLTGGTQGLLLCPPAELAEWGRLVRSLVRPGTVRVEVAAGEVRPLRQLRAGALDLLVTSPDTALALMRRSALKSDAVSALVLAWPERLAEGDVLAELMHDLPRECQRILFTALPDQAQDLVERYARKAITAAVPGPPGPAPVPPAAPAVRTVSVAWSRRAAALAEVLELLDPPTVAVWLADSDAGELVRSAVSLDGSGIDLATADAPTAGTVIAFDLPTAGRLAQLRQAGEVVLLVPPGTESYAALIAPGRRPLRLSGPLEAATGEAASRRQAIAQVIESQDLSGSLLALAPLFERHDPAAVAAALYQAWTVRAPAAPPSAPATESAPPASASARIWVGIGKSEGVTANDFVGLMTKELRVLREAIGRIELRDSYSLIEVPGRDAEAIARSLNGATIRRKRLVARVDRGAASASGTRGPARPRAPRR